MRLDQMFCTSQTSTAICSSTDHLDKTTTTSTAQHGSRAIDRHNPIIIDSRRSFSIPSLPTPPCTSLQPINPKQMYYHLLPKTSKPLDGDSIDQKHKKKGEPKRKSSASSLFKLLSDDISIARKSISCARPSGSSRYLLSDLDGLSGCDPFFTVVTAPDPKKNIQGGDKSIDASKPNSSSFLEKKPSSAQVVVLRVSLHCKGCEGKVRKHLSRMQGVTSFSIDFAAKKVTVTGDVTPSGVLASISKVKNAQLWTTPPSSTSSSLQANPEFKNPK